MTKPYSELSGDKIRHRKWEWPSEKEEREKRRPYIKNMDIYKRHANYHYFEIQFECFYCKEQRKGSIAMHKHSPSNKCQISGFITGGDDGLMCNKCYYGI